MLRCVIMNGAMNNMINEPGVYKHAVNLHAIYHHNTAVRPDKTAFRYYGTDKQIAELTYGQLGENIERLTGAFRAKGLSGKRIAVIGETCHEWITAFFAAVGAESVIVPLDKELLYNEIKGFLDTAEVTAIVMSPKFSEKYDELKQAGVFDNIEIIIRGDDGTEWVNDDKRLYKFSEFLRFDDGVRMTSAEIYTRPPRTDMSVMLFTSGTTGTSKCVMLTERNIVDCACSAVAAVDFHEDDVSMSVLPLHHTYELTITVAEFILGLTICINDNLKHVLKNLKTFKPTALVLVPLFVSTFAKKIRDEVRKKGKERQLKIGMAASNAMRTVGVDMRSKLFADILCAFGGNLKKIICGGAAMDPELTKFFDSFGVDLCEGYGITECSPLIAVNPFYKKKTGSVGPAVNCCEARIDESGTDEKGHITGEIQVRGTNVMLGYYKNPEANAAVFTSDGWFRTGDIGYMDKDGYIYITGREKSVIVLNNGKNVFPEEIEEYLGKIERISECVVVGRKKEETGDISLTAVVYPDFSRYEPDTDINDIAADIKTRVLEMNKKLPSFKQIRNIEIRKTEFEKTTSRKIKRFLVK